MFDKLDVENLILIKNCNEYGLFYGYMVKYDEFEKNYEIKNFRRVGLNYHAIK